MGKSDPEVRQAILEVLREGRVQGDSMRQLHDECGFGDDCSIHAFKRALGSLIHTGQVLSNRPLPSGPADASGRTFTLQLVQ